MYGTKIKTGNKDKNIKIIPTSSQLFHVELSTWNKWNKGVLFLQSVRKRTSNFFSNVNVKLV